MNIKNVRKEYLAAVVLVAVGAISLYAYFEANAWKDLTEEETLILEQFERSQRVDVIVKVNNSQVIEGILKSIPESDIKFTGSLTNGFAAEITLNAFRILRSHPDVEVIYYDRPVSSYNIKNVSGIGFNALPSFM